MTEETKTERFSLEKAQEALNVARRQKIDQCWREIGAVLEKHGLALVAVPSISGEGRIVARPRLVDAPKG